MGRDLPGLDTSRPNVARVNDYILGGTSNFAADRVAAERILAHLPQQRASALEHRALIGRAVRFLAAERGIDQFLDIGSGLPTKQSVHQAARSVRPAARVAYVDNDPLVVSHGKALLAERDCSVVAQADLRDPGALLSHPEISRFLDFGRPVALILASVLHFIPDADEPGQVVAALRDAVAPGSYLALTHLSMDLIGAADQEPAARAARVFDTANMRLVLRSRAEVLLFFDGWDLIEPGLVPKHAWHPECGADAPAFDPSWAGVGCKPS
ncbi:MAG TPA: SAM-dependent methyltransferase [Trebonia sp.]|nr:SAM-dependent methyltransferase [Trebonia sp.]